MWYLCPPIYLSLTTGPLSVMGKAVFLFPKCSVLSTETPASVAVTQTRPPPVVLMTASAPAASPPVPCLSISYSPYIFYLLGQPVVVLAVFFMTASITLTGEFVCLLLWLWRSLLYLLSTFHPLYQSSAAFSTAASVSWVYRLLQAKWERKWLTVCRLYIPFVCSFTPPRLQSW